MSAGFVVWFTGLSGSGKSTLTSMLAAELRRRRVHVETLDGDEVRKHLSKGLGFSRADRDANIRRIGFVAKLVARSGGCAIAAAISPYREVRDEIRRSTPRFFEVYTECPLEVLSERDPKGLYKKALAGEIKNFTGVDDPYQPPNRPEVHLHTDTETPEQSVARIIGQLEHLGYVPTSRAATPGLPERRASVLAAPHGAELVDRTRRGDVLEQLLASAPILPRVTVDRETACWIAAIGNGLLSPLTGFVSSKDHRRILDAMRLETGTPWALPLVLDVPESRREELSRAERVALHTESGDLRAVLTIQDVWKPDRDHESNALFGTSDLAHPGVARLLDRGPVYVGGQLECVSLGESAELIDPSTVRSTLSSSDPHRALAITSPLPPTRAEEHVLRCALDLGDAVVCAVGTAGEAPSNSVLAWRRLLGTYFRPGAIAHGGYPRPAHASAGRLALHDSIVARNLGCTGRIVMHGSEPPSHPHADEIDVAVITIPELGWSSRIEQLTRLDMTPTGPDGEKRHDPLGFRPEIAALLEESRKRPG